MNNNEQPSNTTTEQVIENTDLVFNGYVTDEHGETLAEFSGVLFFKPLQRGVTKASLRAGFGIQTTPATPGNRNNAQLAGFKAKVKR
ncbi:hypothetical protein [Klebsiella pneumoniae]|uniref:hypothetical protein n=1 Tax=Klebsiella pneumoniae TaxID=573 RepID=UPI00374F6A82